MFLPRLKLKDATIHCVKYLQILNRNISRNSVMMRIPILYGDEASPPVRFVMMTASILNTRLDFYQIDLFNGDNKTEFYKNINALQKVPALKVENNVIIDSHAIALYLCNIKDRQDIYPSNALEKARVDQILFFNACVLFPVDSAIFSNYFAGKWPANTHLIEDLYKALDILEELLIKGPWLTSEKISLADICCAATVSSCEILVPTLSKYKLVKNWLNTLQQHPCFEINTRGLKRLKKYVKQVGL